MPVLSIDDAGEGTPVVLLHGLTATKRYVVMGSRSLERSGHRVLGYDARGHGDSEPASEPAAYGYAELAQDLEAVLDGAGLPSAVLVGASMGAHTAVALALRAPERVAGLVVVTPAFDPESDAGTDLDRWDRLSAGLRTGGVEGFVEAYDVDHEVPERWRDTVRTVLRQRLRAHAHPEAVADALQAVPRSRPFERWDQLGGLGMPAVVVADRDEADPGHPLATGERYATELAAELVVEEAGRSPIAWQGGQLSKVIAALASRT